MTLQKSNLFRKFIGDASIIEVLNFLGAVVHSYIKATRSVNALQVFLLVARCILRAVSPRILFSVAKRDINIRVACEVPDCATGVQNNNPLIQAVLLGVVIYIGYSPHGWLQLLCNKVWLLMPYLRLEINYFYCILQSRA